MSEPTVTRAPDPDGPTVAAGDATGNPSREPPAPPGYELHALIGGGGMGEVYRARDLELDRAVAVKILLPQYAPDSPTARRFVDEARITGRLQHPGIPAVYRVGALPDGRPFLAMKLIDGRTLEDMLQSAPSPSGAGQPPAGFERAMHQKLDRLEVVLRRGRFLAIFEQIAQAVGYAHQKGVIHRDLKPANVMVGAFGEVQVMDWGIARSADRRPAALGEPAEPGATVDYAPPVAGQTPNSDLTQAGAILGTPAYMPPEQAIGAVDQVGKRSDVFGLGAILCVVLTGQPPFVSASAESTRQIAARGKLDDAFARLDGCGAEPELVALAKRCLAPDAADRPADAGEVAAAVAAFRADAERRARQAETDRATAEVKAAEQRKRRRVQLALALALLSLVVATGAAAWWLDSERKRQQGIQQAEEFQREAELAQRRQVTSYNVTNACLEALVLHEQGLKQAEDPAEWARTLTAARAALKRAEDLIEFGEATDELRNKVAGARAELDRDEQDRALIAELDRIADSNEVRLFFPVGVTDVISRQFESAFRSHGIDLVAAPAAEAAAWLKQQRFRDRLVLAVRAWRHSLPYGDTLPFPGAGHAHLASGLAALGGGPAAAAWEQHPSRGEKLDAILAAVTEDPFTREWWEAVRVNDGAKLKKLVARPELQRMSSRELASLAHGVGPFSPLDDDLGLLDLAHERFPGEFWVHMRLAFRSQTSSKPGDPGRDRRHETLRHLTAAVAIRPGSAVARAMLGMELLEEWKDEAAGLRWLRSAAKAEPTSPWPHLFLGMHALEKRDWPAASASLKDAVRASPDTAYFIVSAAGLYMFASGIPGQEPLPEAEILALLKELLTVHPNHPGGHQLLGQYLFRTGDHRPALAELRKARDLQAPEHPWQSVVEGELETLEAEARWEAKLPAVLRGELKPADADELRSLVDYCATFEKKYALAARLAAENLAADPKRFANTANLPHYAGWALKAAAGADADAAGLAPAERARLRRQALGWLRDSRSGVGKELLALTDFQLRTNPHLVAVREPKELAKLPANERAEWEKFWADVAELSGLREPAPPPREVMR